MPTLAEIQASIDNISVANDSIDFVTLATQAYQETNTLSYCSVKTIDMLPDLYSGEIPNGHIIYVEETGGPVISSNKTWISLQQKNLVRDDSALPFTHGWGYNCYGAIGLRKGGNILTPTNLSLNFCDFSTSFRNSAGVDLSGSLWTTGCNDQSQLGLGISSSSMCECTSWTRIQDGSLRGSWCNVTTGYYSMVGITTSGQAYFWGYSSYGLGGNNSCNTSVPCLASWANGAGCCWCRAYGGNNFLFLTDTLGRTWGAGENGSGQLGVGNCCSFANCLRQLCGGGVYRKIAPSSTSIAGVRTDGSLWTWGRNYHQSLGLGCGNSVNVPFPTQVLGGGTTYCDVSMSNDQGGAAVKTDGTLWTWGYNNSGQMGINCCPNLCFSSPVQVAGGKTDWCAVTHGHVGFNALTTDGRMWGWGANSFGQIGDGTSIPRSSPTLALGGSTYIKFASSSTGDEYHTLVSKF